MENNNSKAQSPALQVGNLRAASIAHKNVSST